MMKSQPDFFAKVHPKAPKPIHELLKDRTLQPRDVAVMYCMVEMVNPRSGRVDIRPTALAERVGMRLPNITNTLKRLREERILVQRKDKNTGGLYYLFCPHYVSVGTENKKGYLWDQFSDAMQEEYDSGNLALKLATPSAA